ncbi:hypothetical protein GOBAR_DD33229 [Gossypium barbadense]|nr:hypothetical protein GOBAR_DD33229 [Gossypium barbadense]
MTEELSDLLVRLNFSEEESVQIMCKKDDHSGRGFESWAIGKIMATETPNREAMYRVFKSLWYTKEEVEFVELKEGAVIVKFGCQEDRNRILNLTPWLFDRCLFSMLPFEKGKDIESYEFGWSPFWLRIYNVPLELMDRQTALDVGNAESQSNSRGESGQTGQEKKDKSGNEEIMSTSPVGKKFHRIIRDGMGRIKNKRKRHWVSGEENIGRKSDKIGKKEADRKFLTLEGGGWMEGCFAISSDRKSGGMALIWREGVDVTIQNYSKHHIDSVAYREEGEKVQFTGFYGHTELNLRKEAWEMLRRVKNTVNEGWIVGGDFNAILNDSEKEGGRRKSRAVMDEFGDILEELGLRDVKTNNGWFTWSNNREGNRLVKERLDRFVVSDDIMEKMPFIASYVVRQSKSDHEVIIMDLFGNRLQEKGNDPKIFFRYNRCWAKEKEARDIISGIWANEGPNLLGKMELVKERLGPWQFKRYRKMKDKVKSLEKDIGRFMDSPMNERTTVLLKEARSKLGKFIDRLKDEQGIWHKDNEEICHVAWDYFNGLFKTSLEAVDDGGLHVIPKCINEDTNMCLNGDFTKNETMMAFSQMDPRKAPGIDGLSGSFYKDHWSTVGNDVLSMNRQSEAEVASMILESFEKMSGQKINLDKSMIYFSPNTSGSHRMRLSNILKMRVVDNLDTYLGLPISIGKKKITAFQGMLDRMANRINSWPKRLLSYGGKEVFVKSVLQSIPTYALSIFFTPVGILDKIQSLISRFWWSSKDKNRG